MNAHQEFLRGHGQRSIGSILVEAGSLSEQDVERIGHLQKEQGLRFGDAALLLGMVTEDQLRFGLSKQFNYNYLPLTDEHPLSKELVAAYQPFGAQAEQLRGLRSQLGALWFDSESGGRALSIVGNERGVGRSYFTANLALAFAQLGVRTLLIDADMRNPRQHELFKLDNSQGLSMLLSGRSDAETIQAILDFDHLSVMTCGPVPPNPQELLNKPLFKLLLDSLSERFDVILVDTAALDTAADAQVVARRTGGALALARKSQTRLFAFTDMVSRMGQSGIAVVGTVFNNPEERSAAV